jgi:hypothetical protein
MEKTFISFLSQIYDWWDKWYWVESN